MLLAHKKEVSMIVEDKGRGFFLIEPIPSDRPLKRIGSLRIRECFTLVSDRRMVV